MKKLLFVALTTVLFFSACKIEEEVPHELNQTWNLMSIVCECSPFTLEKGDYTFTFDTGESSVEIVNNIPEDNDGHPWLWETGSYEMVWDESAGTIQILTPPTEEWDIVYDYSIEDGILFISDQPELDGPLMRLEK